MEILLIVILFLTWVISISRMSTRIDRLRFDVDELKKKLSTHAVVPRPTTHEEVISHGQHTETASVPPPPPHVAPAPPPPPVPVVVAEDPFMKWIKEDWQLKLGAFLILMAAGWFVSYAIWENWIGPVARIALGMVTGEIVFGFGWWRMYRRPVQGTVFMVLGATITLLTTYAGRELYQLFSPVVALTLMFVVSSGLTVASVYFDSRKLSIIGLCMAAAAPLFVHSTSPDYVGLFSYLAIVVGTGLAIVLWKGYRELTFTGMCIMGLYSLPLLTDTSIGAPLSTLLLFMYGFSALFFITGTLEVLKNDGHDITLDLITATGGSLLLLGWVHVAAPVGFETIILLVCAAFVLAASFAVYATIRSRTPFYIYFGKAMVYIGVATAVQFTGHALAIAFTLEAAAIVLSLYVLTREIKTLGTVSLVFVVPVLASLPSLAAIDPTSRSNDASIVLGVLAMTALGLCLYFRYVAQDAREKIVRSVSVGYLVLGAVYTGFTLASLYSDQSLALALIGLAVCVVIATRLITEESKSVVMSSFAFIVPIIASFSSLSALDPSTRSSLDTTVLLVMTGASALLCAYFRYTFSPDDEKSLRGAIYSFYVMAIVYGATTLASIYSDQSLAVALTLESIAVVLLLRYIGRADAIMRTSTFVLIIPGLLALPSLDSGRWPTVFSSDFLVLFTVSAAIFMLGTYFRQQALKEDEIPANRHAGAVLYIIGSVVAYILLWLSLAVQFASSPSTGVMVALTVYTVIGIFFSFYGTQQNSHLMRVYGGSLVMAVVLRLFVVDVWEMGLPWRIVTFFVIGALLVSTAFLVRIKKHE